MNYVNYDDVIGQLMAAGFQEPRAGWDAAIDCGRKAGVRCKVEGARQGGAISLHSIALDDGRMALIGAGWYWIANDKTVVKLELRVDAKKVRLDADKMAAIKAKQAEIARQAELQRQREIDRAAAQAAVWWRKLSDAGRSGYMAKKGFDASELFGARVSPSGNLVIPVQDITGKTYGLQVILKAKNRQGRDKDFTPPGLAKKGHFYQMGLAQRGAVVLLCEGFATGASLRKATGLPVIVAFDAGNLLPVAMEIHKAHRKDVRILICADDDYLTDARTGKNPGRDAAQTAALAVDGKVVSPIFPGDRPTDTKGPTDFNDLHVHPDGGLQAVRSQIEAAIASAGWRARVTVARAPAAPQGAGAGNAQQGAGETPRAQAIMPLEDIVERFIPLDDGTGDYVWDTWTRKIVKTKQMIVLLPAGVRGDDIKRHPVWIERGAYYLSQVGFDPTMADPTVQLNTWRGWPMQPKAGSCEVILDLLRYLCTEDRIFRWLLCWMAWPLQHPGAKLGSAVIMHGPQGTGKSVIFNRVMATIYGDYATVLNQRGLEDRFNADWIDSKLYMCAEEVVARAEMWHIKNELKEMVTGEWVRINPKNVAAYRQRNQVNFVYLSNEGQPLPIDNDDRRHLVVYTPPKLSPAFYDDVFAEIESGGIAAFYDYLLKLDIEATYQGWHPNKHPPMTEAKQALMDLSAPSEMRFVTDWLSGDADLPVCPALANDVYDAYMRWCRKNGEARPRPSNHFIGTVARLTGWDKRKVQVYGSADYMGDPKVQSVIFPPDQALQASGHAMPEGHAQIRWITESCVAFRDKSNGDSKWSN